MLGSSGRNFSSILEHDLAPSFVYDEQSTWNLLFRGNDFSILVRSYMDFVTQTLNKFFPVVEVLAELSEWFTPLCHELDAAFKKVPLHSFDAGLAVVHLDLQMIEEAGHLPTYLQQVSFIYGDASSAPDSLDIKRSFAHGQLADNVTVSSHANDDRQVAQLWLVDLQADSAFENDVLVVFTLTHFIDHSPWWKLQN